MSAKDKLGTRSDRQFRRPLRFRIRLLWATHWVFRLSLLFVITAIVTLALRYFLPALPPFLDATGIWLSQPGISTLIGVLVGAGISLIVSITLQRDQYKAKSLLDRNDEIYEPLLRSVIAFLHQLETQPYPWRIAHIGWVPSFSLQPQAGFLEWSDLVTSGRVIYVPTWLRQAFEAIDSNIEEYNNRIAASSAEIQALLIHELRKTGLIESASGFSEISLILSADYEAKVITPFSQMKHPEGKTITQEDIADVLPPLFREYGQRTDIQTIRTFFSAEIIARATWLKSALEDVIRFIELAYGSRDPHL